MWTEDQNHLTTFEDRFKNSEIAMLDDIGGLESVYFAYDH